MGVVERDIENIYEALQENFLYKNDITSIHMLLNLYDIEKNISNIFPRYVSVNNLKKYISKNLRNRKGHHLISLNLGQLIHEDINRLELYIYIEGYKKGYFNKFWVNVLENKTLKNMSIEELYDHKFLYHFNVDKECILEIKDGLNKEIDTKEKDNEFIKGIISNYCENIIKRKIMSFNEYMDSQLVIDCGIDSCNIIDESDLLSLKELDELYEEIVKILYKNCMSLYRDALWYGINDRVLKRYR